MTASNLRFGVYSAFKILFWQKLFLSEKQLVILCGNREAAFVQTETGGGYAIDYRTPLR